MMQQKDLESREYDVNDIVEDRRFIRCKTEMWIIVIMGLIQILVPAAIIYSLNGNGKWFVGLPMWYGVATLFYLCMLVASMIVATKVIRTHKLDAIADDKEES
ncbi:MAG: hypothetical protein Q4D31_03290 [Eubacteriales bacterium]|nr:hypothetical protein [Eubacteriales bacterium]